MTFEQTSATAVESLVNEAPGDYAARGPQRLPRRGAILVVDQAAATRRLLGGLLRARGFEVEMVSDGESALRAAGRRLFHFVILEAHVPLCDGFTVVQALRSRPETRELPVLVISDDSMSPEELRAMRLLGASGYLAKTALEDEVLDRIEALLELTQQAVPA